MTIVSHKHKLLNSSWWNFFLARKLSCGTCNLFFILCHNIILFVFVVQFFYTGPHNSSHQQAPFIPLISFLIVIMVSACKLRSGYTNTDGNKYDRQVDFVWPRCHVHSRTSCLESREIFCTIMYHCWAVLTSLSTIMKNTKDQYAQSKHWCGKCVPLWTFLGVMVCITRMKLSVRLTICLLCF